MQRNYLRTEEKAKGEKGLERMLWRYKNKRQKEKEYTHTVSVSQTISSYAFLFRFEVCLGPQAGRSEAVRAWSS